MRLLGERVGPKGSITGLDSDGNFGAEALAMLAASTPSGYRFVEADLTTVTALEGGWVKPSGTVVHHGLRFANPRVYSKQSGNRSAAFDSMV
jgi:hypothetical protein